MQNENQTAEQAREFVAETGLDAVIDSLVRAEVEVERRMDLHGHGHEMTKKAIDRANSLRQELNIEIARLASR